MGILCAGGVSSGIYPTDSSTQVEYLINDSSTRVIFAEDEEQLDKILSCRSRCPTLQKIVVFDMPHATMPARHARENTDNRI